MGERGGVGFGCLFLVGFSRLSSEDRLSFGNLITSGGLPGVLEGSGSLYTLPDPVGDLPSRLLPSVFQGSMALDFL